MARDEKKAKRAPAPARAAARPAAAPAVPRWPVWLSIVLTVTYLAIHLHMLPVAARLWVGLARALLLGD